MKVLGVVTAHPLRKMGGVANAAFELSSAISKVIPYKLAMQWDEDETCKQNGLEVFRFRAINPLSSVMALLPGWVYIPLYSSGIPAFVEEGDFDLVHIHTLIPTLAMKKVADACLRGGIPYCVSSHSFMEVLDYPRIMKFGFSKTILTKIFITRPFLSFIKNAAWIFATSPYDDKIIEKLNFPKERSSRVTNGVKQFFLDPPSDSEMQNLRQKLKLVEDRNPKLLFMGSLFPYKGVDTFLASLHKIPYPVTAIVGGKLKSNAEKQMLLRKANASLLRRHQIIFTGWLSDTDLRSLYHTADIFVYPTRGDTLPLCVLEAMGSSLPVVSTEVGGIPFQLANGAGFLAKPDDPEGIAQIVRRLIEHLDLRKLTGRAARKRVEEVFNWDKAALSAIDGYKKIINLYYRGRHKAL